MSFATPPPPTILTERKAENGLATGLEYQVRRPDGIMSWVDELYIDPDALEAFETKKRQREQSKCRPLRPLLSKPSENAAYPKSLADGPRSGDQIETRFPSGAWHCGTVHNHEAGDERGPVYTVMYDNGRLFKDCLSLRWRLISRPEPTTVAEGPSVGDGIHVAFSVEGRAKPQWYAGTVQAVRANADGLLVYTVVYSNGVCFTDRLNLPWRPARATAPLKKAKRARVAEVEITTTSDTAEADPQAPCPPPRPPPVEVPPDPSMPCTRLMPLYPVEVFAPSPIPSEASFTTELWEHDSADSDHEGGGIRHRIAGREASADGAATVTPLPRSPLAAAACVPTTSARVDGTASVMAPRPAARGRMMMEDDEDEDI